MQCYKILDIPGDLIDTLWNVKITTSDGFTFNALDLIDTLWNVKTSGTDIDRLINERFNRYIVECKAARGSEIHLAPFLI